MYVTCVRDGTCKTDKANSHVNTSATIEFSHETKTCIALSTENRQKLKVMEGKKEGKEGQMHAPKAKRTARRTDIDC